MGARGVLRTLKGGFVGFHCPGCRRTHALRVEGDGSPRWGFNGDYDKPTFSPSILATWESGDPPVTPENAAEWHRQPWPQTTVKQICHSFVRDGRIEFLSDCTHELAGKTVEMTPEEIA